MLYEVITVAERVAQLVKERKYSEANKLIRKIQGRITSYNVCYTKLLRA